MNTTRQLSERITDAIENIPNGFRTIDKDALLNDIRNLYDAVLSLEPSTETSHTTVSETTPANAPEPEVVINDKVEPEPVKVEEPIIEEEPKVKVATSESTTPSTEMDPDEGTLAGKLNQKPIADLRSGIPLNEKFGFIQNLFQNNASDYGDAILKMNNASDETEALTHFDTLADRKNWDAENHQVSNLRSYIERRHLMVSEANADQ